MNVSAFICKTGLLAAGFSILANGRSVAQVNAYRLTPPMRLAARSIEEPIAVDNIGSDPFRLRDTKRNPATVAVGGYCLVSLRDQRQWVLGSPKIQVIRGEKIYRFSTHRALAIFAAAPEQYLPVLDGDCIVTFAETGERRPGRLQWGLVHQRRLYFFVNEEMMARFEQDPSNYVNADLADGGFCIVSKIDENRVVRGLPETVTIAGGMRYFFASAYHRKLFQNQPEKYIGEHVPMSDMIVSIDKSAPPESMLDPPVFGDIAAHNPALTSTKLLSKKKSLNGGERDREEQVESRAMSGYCPVTIKTQGLWQRGKSKFKSSYDGRVYFMAGPEEQATFKANPREFVPVLGGDSVVSLVNGYQRVAGSIFHAVQYKGRLYLFADAEEKRAFGEQPEVYETADLAYNGKCVVSQRDEQRDIAGSPDFVAVHRGMRYLFASEKKLKKFLADPKVYEDQ